MKNFKRVLTIILFLLTLFFSIKLEVNYLDKVSKKIIQTEKHFQLAAQEIITNIDNGQVQLVGPEKFERVNGVVQTEWLLISSVRHNKASFYTFKIYSLPTPDGFKKWVILPCFYSPTENKIEDWLGYYVEAFNGQLLVDDDPVEQFYPEPFHAYKEEPQHSTLLLLQKFVKWQNNQAKH